jgi:DNA-binding transcriptional regulator YiaG
MTPSEIKALKDKSGLSWQGFAEKIGVSARTARYWCEARPGVKAKQPGRLALKALEQFAKKVNP